MALQQCVVTSFKQEMAQALHNFGPTTPDTFKIALYGESATLGPATTAYTSTGEVSASGYSAGGSVLTINVNPTASGTGAYWSFASLSWSAALTARGALIYNATHGNRAVAVLDFGSNKTSLSTFTVQFPAAGITTAILRIKGIAS